MPAPLRLLSLAATAALLAACTPAADAPTEVAPAAETVPGPVVADPALANGAAAGVYTLDKYHASLVFAANHLGFSDYVGQFTRFDATLTIDPAAPENATLIATVDLTSLIVPTPPEGFHEELLGPQWLNAVEFPELRYESTAVTLTSPNTAKIDGNLTFRGMTLPLSFDARFNGAYAGFPPYDPNARAGFHAEGTLSRSAFGMVYGLPPEGTTMGVPDPVKFWIDAEFHGPPSEAAPAGETPTP